jgi:hypothetical protein
MAELTLSQALGSSATQDATTITLNKADLGLTATTCTADQVVAAVIIKAQATMTEANFQAEADQRTYISNGFPSTVTKTVNSTLYVIKQLVLNLCKPEVTSSLDPNDY